MHLARRRAQQLSEFPTRSRSCTHSSKPKRSVPVRAQANHHARPRDAKFESLESCYAVVEMAVSVIRSIVLCMGVVSTDLRGHHCHRKGLAQVRRPGKPPVNAKPGVQRARSPTRRTGRGRPREPGPEPVRPVVSSTSGYRSRPSIARAGSGERRGLRPQPASAASRWHA